MVQSEFSIKTLGVHFGNYVLDNSHWDKISHSLTKKQHLKQSATLFEMKKKKKELQAKSSYPNFGIQVKYILFQTLSKRKLEKKKQKKTQTNSTLHLQVWTRYFRHRYTIKFSRT